MKIKGRAWLRRFTLVLVLLFGHISLTTLLVGIGLILFGMLWHLWAIGCLVRNTELTTWGPYRFVRHPFYLGNFIIDIGICVAAFNPYIIAAYLLLFYLIYYRRMKMEEAHLTTLFHEKYPEFMKYVPLFIPLFFRRFPAIDDKGFTWSMVIKSGNELRRLSHLLIYPIVLYFQLRQFPTGLMATKLNTIKIGQPELLLFGAILALTFVSWLSGRGNGKTNHKGH